MKTHSVKQPTNDPTIDLVLDTLEKNKQALVFVNAKRSAEKTAEDVARALSKKQEKTNIFLSDAVLNALQKPTKQCERLADVVKYGIAFHHAGLAGKQKELIEDNFRKGIVKIICCTPTLAAGVDLPAFRTIIRDVKRFSVRGYVYIPVLEYHQMSGRAGRPKYDTEGEAIAIADTEAEKEMLIEHYIHGKPEEITSKLAVEPVLRTYVLSLIASNFVNSRKTLLDFFSKTFWAHQFQDLSKIEKIMDRMIHMLEDFTFIETKTKAFASADELLDNRITATDLGRRVAQLYIDPLTAHIFIEAMERKDKPSFFALLQLISHTLEIRPRLRVKSKEHETYDQLAMEHTDDLLVTGPTEFEPDYDEYLDSIKTAAYFGEWIEERDDEFLLEHYDIRPGENYTKLETADWLLYSLEELSKLLGKREFATQTTKLRIRIRYGAKEELLPLLRLREIGRVRARKLFGNDIKDLGDIKKADFAKLKFLLGEAVAKSVKEQVGEKTEEIRETKRKGQMSIEKYSKKDLNKGS